MLENDNHKVNTLISVIITTYNRPDFLSQALETIQEQTYTNLEILLIDDGSSPELADMNEKISNKFSKCNYFYKPNSGQPDSRNFGVIRAKGSFIGFCDDDDFWALDKLEKQMALFSAYPDAFAVNCCMQYISEDGEQLGHIKCHDGHNSGYVFSSFLEKNRTASITPLLKKEVFKQIGYFNGDFTIAEDWEFWRRLSFYYEIFFINEVLAYVRVHDNSMMHNHNHTPLTSFRLSSKLTRALVLWGKNRFNKEDLNLIYTTEWNRLRKVLGNHYPGIPNKLQFLANFGFNNFKDTKHLLKLFMISLYNR